MPTKIPMYDYTWNPIIGCTKVSEGCRNCYAERQANRMARMPQAAGRVLLEGRELEWLERADIVSPARAGPTAPLTKASRHLRLFDERPVSRRESL